MILKKFNFRTGKLIKQDDFYSMIVGGLMQVYDDQTSLIQDLNTIVVSTFIDNHNSLTLASVTSEYQSLKDSPHLMKTLISHLAFVSQDDYKIYL